ncbi:Hypothetical_protein [Hexamita inflata]|uniref:Hypothetical_protein n=1 Tax=Hexamita inflata TaxID=28002 RepID=A0AA86UIE4_9EUKA|nr:Hypothetical protein HINF_LOCUS40082 [Hexamita inflata]
MRMKKMNSSPDQKSQSQAQLQKQFNQYHNEVKLQNESQKNLQVKYMLLQQNMYADCIDSIKKENDQLRLDITNQSLINKQAVEKLYNNEAQINSQKLLSRAKNMEHIMKYVNDPEIQELFFDLNNTWIEMDSQYDMKQFFNSKAQAKAFYHEMIGILQQNRKKELLQDFVQTLIKQSK